MERVTRKQLENMVGHLNKGLNRPTEHHQMGENIPYKQNKGHLCLDYNPSYGGYLLAELDEHGERNPIGGMRHSASEMYHILYALMQVICYGELQPFPKQ